jgi:6-phospho-3-hexuloisomerase
VWRKRPADVLFLTAEPETPASKLATHVLTIPAQTMARDTGDAVTSVLPMGSLYEGVIFVLFEVMVPTLCHMQKVSAEDMRARHTNME